MSEFGAAVEREINHLDPIFSLNHAHSLLHGRVVGLWFGACEINLSPDDREILENKLIGVAAIAGKAMQLHVPVIQHQIDAAVDSAGHRYARGSVLPRIQRLTEIWSILHLALGWLEVELRGGCYLADPHSALLGIIGACGWLVGQIHQFAPAHSEPGHA